MTFLGFCASGRRLDDRLRDIGAIAASYHGIRGALDLRAGELGIGVPPTGRIYLPPFIGA